jgi:hypothetical protein
MNYKYKIMNYKAPNLIHNDFLQNLVDIRSKDYHHCLCKRHLCISMMNTYRILDLFKRNECFPNIFDFLCKRIHYQIDQKKNNYRCNYWV